MFVLAAARLGEPGALLEAGLPTRTLTGLDLAGTGQLARQRGGDVPAAALAQVHRATGGNPLAVIALVAEPDRLREATPGAPVPVPARIAAWFARRAAGLDPDTHRRPAGRRGRRRRPGRGVPRLRGARPRRRRGWPQPSGPGW